MSGECELCRPARRQASRGLSRLLGTEALELEVLAQTLDFLVILDTAPVTAGHVLIIPRAHERSFARYWSCMPKRVDAIVDAVRATLRHATGQRAVVCEHGLGRLAKGHAGCVEHAHLHVIPAEEPLADSFSRTGVDLRETAQVAELVSRAAHKQYLYLRDADDRQYVAVCPSFPSQLVRRLVAHQHAEVYWSWRDYLDFADQIGTRGRLLAGREVFEGLGSHPIFTESAETA